MIQDQVFGVYPNFCMSYRSGLNTLPSIFNISGDCIAGNSGGSNLEAVQGGFGEYIERFHFYNEVKIDLTAKINEKNNQYHADKFLQTIKQIQQNHLDARNYEFDLTKVRHIFSEEDIYVPTMMLTLAHANSEDRKYIPFMDSCGQAAHITKEASFNAALNEFVERQALISAWLSGQANIKINLDVNVNVNEIYSRLLKHGRLIAYDLNINLPGYSIIIFYFSNSTKDSVRYSVGMASDSCAKTAFLRALNELWQSYMFIYLNADKPENLDDRYVYLNQLLSFNNHETENKIPFHGDHVPEVSLTDYFVFPDWDKNEILEALSHISTAIYAYEGSISLFGRLFNYCKVFSTDFFLHMGITQPLNFQNAFADSLSLQVKTPVLQPIPFP